MADQQSNNLNGELLSIQREFLENGIDDDKLILFFECNEKIFKVMLVHRTLPGFDNGSDSIEQGFLQRLGECGSWDGGPDDEPEGLEENMNQVYAEVEELTKQLLQPIFSDRAPNINKSQDHPSSLPKDLDAYMNPEAFTFQFVTKSGKPTLIPRDDLPPPCLHPPISDLIQISPNTPRLPSSSIKVLEQLGRSWVLKVVVDGQIMCCKITNQAIHESLSQEYSALQQIAEKSARSTRSTRLRVPGLKGVVESKKGQVIGILMEFIPTISNLADIITSGDDQPVETARRTKWASQIERTLRGLHAADVVWGDAKTSNILIDDKDDAWIVDFGGGQTWGWVDTELVGTKEGDMQALQKIRQALQM